MLYNIINTLRPWLVEHGLFGFFRVWTYIEFRAIASVLFSFLFVLITGKSVIRWLLKQKIGDNPEFNNKSLNELMKDKSNTPTMGGIVICGAIIFSTYMLADLSSFYVRMAFICLLWLAMLGGADDWLKLTTARRTPGSRTGLYSWEKLVFQLALGVLLGIFIHHYGDTKWDSVGESDILSMSRSLTIPLMKSWQWDGSQWIPSANLVILGTWSFVLLTTFVIAGMSNAVNLTDGMDGLASGIMAMISFAFMILCIIAGNEVWAKNLLVPYIPLSNELAIVSGSMMGACLGFLWFNAHPAEVFMGDTGSLPLGGLIAYIAVVIRQEFLLMIVGGVLVMELLSVVLQVGYFKATKGKRIFRCAPIHHHFHMGGTPENRVVVRMWLATAALAALAIATIKVR
jgi:phospho-N-acetylmuramoyl-pentapeptide-transferase